MTRERQPSTQRLFTAIPLPPDIRHSIAGVIEELSGAVDGVRWVPEENLHITLRFLGDCTPDTIPKMAEAMRKAARHLPAVVRIGGVGGFPSVRSARVVWVGVEDLTGAVEKVYNVLDKGAEKCGFSRERRGYRPHITIGRSRRKPVSIPEDMVAGFAADTIEMEAGAIVLFRSRISSTGASYSVVETAGPGAPDQQ